MLTKQKPHGEKQGRGTQENFSAMWLSVSGFMRMGLASGLSLASHFAWPTLGLAQGPSWWCVHFSAMMDSSTKDPERLAISSLLVTPPKSSQLAFREAPYQGLLL